MAKVMCPRCGKPHAKGERCPKAPDVKRRHGARTADQERGRKTANPWRSEYSSAQYLKARQAALARTGGRCAVTGEVIADMRNGRWVMRGNGGVHHIVPLSSGGSNDPSNLVPMCTSAHNKADAARRRNAAR